MIGLISGEQSGCLQLRPRPAHQLRELGVRGRQPAAEAALLHPPLRELRLKKRHCYGVGQTATDRLPRVPQILPRKSECDNLGNHDISKLDAFHIGKWSCARDSRLENLNREDGEAEAAEEEAKT